MHVVEIELPTPFYFLNDVKSVPDGYSKVEYVKNKAILTNNDRVTYKVNENSGTLNIIE